MKITGLETLVFAVDDVAGAARYLADYGLDEVQLSAAGGRYEALDGTSIVIVRQDDASLPPPPSPGCRLRKTTMGVVAAADLDPIEAELRRDREVRRRADGAIESVDDAGFAIGFQVAETAAIRRSPEKSPTRRAALMFRPVNHLGSIGPTAAIRPRSLSHVVYFVPDVLKAEAFYVNRLGFRCTDRFAKRRPVPAAGATLDHHTHFLIGAPPHMHGVEHFTFHFGGPTEMITNGYRFVAKGYQAFWGPGRHILGSNWFWYFNSPFACHIEMDADMDLHDTSWTPRTSRWAPTTRRPSCSNSARNGRRGRARRRTAPMPEPRRQRFAGPTRSPKAPRAASISMARARMRSVLVRVAAKAIRLAQRLPAYRRRAYGLAARRLSQRRRRPNRLPRPRRRISGRHRPLRARTLRRRRADAGADIDEDAGALYALVD